MQENGCPEASLVKKPPNLNYLPEHMSWDEYSFKKGKMSFIAQDFDSRKIVAILDGRTQVTIRNHFLRYSRQGEKSCESHYHGHV